MNQDAIWHNSLTSQNAWSQLSGSTIVDSKPLGTTDSTWKLSATGDFDRDGELDLLWRHESGATQWWLLRDGQFKAVQQILAIPDQAWQIVGTGDFNRDGQLDILWRHQPTGTNQAWIMPLADPNNGILSPLAGLALPSVPLDWKVGATGDVDQDGATDILWTHVPSGASQWWQMQQASIVGASVLSDRLQPTQTITASADFNGDGTLDLVVYDGIDGTSRLWLMSKFAPGGIMSTIDRAVITPDNQLKPFGWHIAGVAKVDAGNTLINATIEANPVFSRSEAIGGLNDRTDVYKFDLRTAGQFSASLSGLSADADLRLIQDGNGQIDSREVLDWRWERGTKNEVLTNVLQPGSYFLEVRSYDDQLTPYQLVTSFAVTPLVPSVPALSKLDIQLKFDVTSAQLDPTTQTALKTAEQFWEDVLVGGGSLLPGGVLPIKITLEDLNLKTGAPDTLTLAYAAPTIASDGQKLLIQGGNLTINRRRLGTLDTTSLNDLFIHEFTHTLGFGTIWEPLRFRMADGSIRSIGGLTADGSRLIDRTNNTYSANSNAGWAYGELRRDAGLTNTLVQTAVPIEADFAAHWDESVFQSESLTPVANSGAQPISILTLAALKDLGWQVNFGKAQDYKLPTVVSAGPSIDFGSLDRPRAAGSVMPKSWATEWPVG